MARKVLEKGLVLDGPYLMAPLYGYFLAAVYGVWELAAAPSVTPVFLLQAGLGAGTAGCAAWLGHRLGGRLSGWVAGIAVAVHAPLVLYDGRLLSVSLCTALTALAAVAMQRAWDRSPGGGRAALGAGLLLGLATLARGNLLLGLPFLLLLFGARAWQDRRALGPAALLALGVAGPLALSALHNQAAGGEAALVSMNGGVNLYRGNNPYFWETAVEDFRIPPDKDALAKRARLVASVAEDRPLSQRETDQYWVGRTLAAWRADPLRYVGLTARKAWQVLQPWEVGDNVDVYGIRARYAPLRWLPMLAGPLVALGLIGLGLRRRGSAPAALLLLTGLGSVALFFNVDRYRHPLIPLWAAFAGVAVAWALSSWRRALVVGLLAAAIGLALRIPATSPWLPWNALAPRVEAPECMIFEVKLDDPEVEAAFRLSVAAELRGDALAAEAHLRRVLVLDPRFGPALVNLSHLLLEAGEDAEAERLAAAAVAASPCDDKAMVNQASALVNLGRGAEARPLLERAVALDPYEAGRRLTLSQVLLGAGEVAAARDQLQWVRRWYPEELAARLALGRLELMEGDPRDARPPLDEAVALAPARPDVLALRGLARLASDDVAGAREDLRVAEALPDGRRDPATRALATGLAAEE